MFIMRGTKSICPFSSWMCMLAIFLCKSRQNLTLIPTYFCVGLVVKNGEEQSTFWGIVLFTTSQWGRGICRYWCVGPILKYVVMQSIPMLKHHIDFACITKRYSWDARSLRQWTTHFGKEKGAWITPLFVIILLPIIFIL